EIAIAKIVAVERYVDIAFSIKIEARDDPAATKAAKARAEEIAADLKKSLGELSVKEDSLNPGDFVVRKGEREIIRVRRYTGSGRIVLGKEGYQVKKLGPAKSE